ncbi:hypothetical protein MYX75_01800 [Acidobacteria bacterium AH-259-A15]|nr:hypothetical protein [Acidobacteria bacterium AH-259-A15]
MRKALLFFMLVCSLSLSGVAQALQVELSSEQTDIKARLNFAAIQHEIILAFLKEGKFSEVLAEFRKVLELDLKGENEKPVVQEAWLIVERLRQSAQYSLAHEIVDETFDQAENRESKFYLLMLKGKIFYDEGLTEEAIAIFRRAQEFKE